MTFRDILDLPVQDLCAEDCYLGLWITNPLTCRIEEVMEAWGFKYSSVLFTWVKTNAKSPGFFMGNGYGSRQNTERCYLGRRGEPARISASVRELIIEPRREHSRKPDCTMPRIERLAGDVQRIELFSRTDRKNWLQWGDQSGKWKL